MDIFSDIQENLIKNQDKAYGEFQSKLIPTISPDTVIGVRTPVLRKLAKELAKREDIDTFLSSLPHSCFEDNQLHAFILSLDKDYAHCMTGLIQFLPFVDNWATCDQMSPKVFKKHLPELVPHIEEWLKSEHTYTIRFGIGMLMEHYLDDVFEARYPEMVAGVRSEEYYVNMMIAWYFATALAKQYDAALPYLTEHRLEKWTHNKTIQKAVESNRIMKEQKEYLKTLIGE